MLERKAEANTRFIRKGVSKLKKTVLEYHFVCNNGEGVTDNSDGTFFSRSWVVSEKILKQSITLGACLYLHNSKREPSYRQGKILGYKKVQALGDGKVRDRIQFHVQSVDPPGVWFGEATGEKGYRWRD